MQQASADRLQVLLCAELVGRQIRVADEKIKV